MSGARSVPPATPRDELALHELPPRVVGAARSAFRDAITDGPRLRPVYDSWDDRRRARVLVFRCPGAALVLMCRLVPDGLRVSGTLVGSPTAVSVVVRRPGRPFLRLATTPDLRLRPATMPRGLVSIATEYCHDGVPVRWHSDWLKL
ncbi:MAG: hypothetical protein QOH10_2878 [Actinomycetota bacterium]|jgi:hypothetical protein|nr:hypothetical protein [Actinomycetota bacterium]